MHLLQTMARAYIYSGAWVADCPRDCGNTEFLFGLSQPRNPASPRTIRKTSFGCSYCGLEAEIDWPPDMEMDALMAVLSLRPVPHNRNWYPQEHAGAIKFRIEHGQSVADLMEENEAHGIGAVR